MIWGRDLQATIQMTKQARVQRCTTHDGSVGGLGGGDKLQTNKHATLTPNPLLLVNTITVHEIEWVLVVGYSDATSKASFLLNSSLDEMEKGKKQKKKKWFKNKNK